MTVLSKIDTVEYFKELPFYNNPIEKLKIKRLKNVDSLAELSFHEQLNNNKNESKIYRICKCRTRLR